MLAIVFTGPGKLELTRRSVPTPGVGQVLVKTSFAGICATDRELINGSLDILPIGSVPGHEIAGRIVEGHPTLSAGTRVVVDPVVACDQCHLCRTGRRWECLSGGELGIDRDGGWAEFLVVDAERVHELPPMVQDADAPLVEPLVCPYGAIASEPSLRGSRVAVFGSGLAALNFVQCSRRFGSTTVDAVVRKDHDLFRSIGAHRIVEDAGELAHRGEYDLVIDAVGSSETASWGPGTAKEGGRILLYGLAEPNAHEFPIREVVLRNTTIRGTTNFPGNWERVLSDIASERLRISDLGDCQLAPNEVPEFITEGEARYRKATVVFV